MLKSTVLTGRQPGGFYLVPTSQLLKPWGEQVEIVGRPVDMTFDSSGSLLAVLNSRSILLLDGTSGATLGEIKTKQTSYAGIAFRPQTRELWASETSRTAGDLVIVEVSGTGQAGTTQNIALPGHPVPTGIAFSSDGSRAFVALSRKNTVAVVDAREKKVLQEIPVGVAPFAVALAEKQGR